MIITLSSPLGAPGRTSGNGHGPITTFVTTSTSTTIIINNGMITIIVIVVRGAGANERLQGST